MAEQLDIQMFARRRNTDVRPNRWHYWGWARYGGQTYSFWMTDRRHGFVFKDTSTYSRGYNPATGRRGFSLDSKIDEQREKGYTDVALTPYRRRQLWRGFMLSVVSGTMHHGRQRTS